MDRLKIYVLDLKYYLYQSLMIKARNLFFHKNCSKDSLFLLNLSKELYNKSLINNKFTKIETETYKNYIFYTKKNNEQKPSVIIEKTLQKYDKYDRLNHPSDLFINLPKISELNINVKMLKNHKTVKLIDAIKNNEKYIIKPFNIYAIETNKKIKKEEQITLEIPSEYSNKFIYQRKSSDSDPLLSNVKVILQPDMNEFILKLTAGSTYLLYKLVSILLRSAFVRLSATNNAYILP